MSQPEQNQNISTPSQEEISSPNTYIRKQWHKVQFVNLSPIEVLDAMYPNTSGHIKRKEQRLSTPNSTKYTIPDQYWFPTNKGFVSNLARIALILGYYTTTKSSTRPTVHTDEYKNAITNMEEFEMFQHFSQPNFNLNPIAIAIISNSNVLIKLNDIPIECHNFTYHDWMIKIATIFLHIDITIEQANQMLCESWAIRRVARILGSEVSIQFYAENYELDIFIQNGTNCTLHPKTNELFKNFQQSSDRSLLQGLITQMNNNKSDQTTNKSTQQQQQQHIPEQQEQQQQSLLENDDERQRKETLINVAQFKCTLPFDQLDQFPRSICPTCKSKVHLYCPMCLQWTLFESIEQATTFFQQSSTIQPNPLQTVLTPPTTPLHPRLLHDLQQKLLLSNQLNVINTIPQEQLQLNVNNDNDIINNTTNTTTSTNTIIPPSYSQYSPYYSSSNISLPSSIIDITPQLIQQLQPTIGLPLPLSIELVHHPGEKLQKSTGLHNCLISPQQSRLVSFPNDIPKYDINNTVILFPTDDAYSPDEINWTQYTHCIIVEATWQGTTSVLNHPHLKDLKKVKLSNYQTLFWRNQQFGSAYLATIEAIYYLCREVHIAMIKQLCITPSTIQCLYNIAQQYTNNNDTSNDLSLINRYALNYQYQGELDDLLLPFLIRLYRVLAKYHTNESQHSQPRTWTLGLNSIKSLNNTTNNAITTTTNNTDQSQE